MRHQRQDYEAAIYRFCINDFYVIFKELQIFCQIFINRCLYNLTKQKIKWNLIRTSRCFMHAINVKQ